MDDEQASLAAEAILAEAIRGRWPGAQRPLFSVIPGGRYMAHVPMGPAEAAVAIIRAVHAQRLYPELSDRLAADLDLRTWFGSLMTNAR